MMRGKKITLILTGGIACYKVLDLIRALKKQGATIDPVMTKAAQEFITPMSVACLSGAVVHDDLWSLKDEVEIGHIKLARDCDMILVAPASANFMAKVAHGMADDLATTLLLATDKPVFFVPAMNPHMYMNEATQDNIALLKRRRYDFVEPDFGLMACNEEGFGRYPDQDKILTAVSKCLKIEFSDILKGKKVLMTLGATQEAIDPVRFISNHSSGIQGLEIAENLRKKGAEVILLKAKTGVKVPSYFTCYDTLLAVEMAEQAKYLLEAEDIDIAICTAAVCDWRVNNAAQEKMKKGQASFSDIEWVENPDILQLISVHHNRPKCVIGFAAETDKVVENAQEKLARKACDMIIYNDVSKDDAGFGAAHSDIGYCTSDHIESWGLLSKADSAENVAQTLIEFLQTQD